MKWITILWILFTFHIGEVTPQTFTPDDQRLGDAAVNYVNPEISPTGDYMIWIEVDTSNGVTGKVWQCGIDPDSGDLIPSDGKGFNPFYSNIYGRPADWGVDSLGVYYVGATFTGLLKLVRPTGPFSAVVTTLSTPADIRRRVFYPSQLPGVNRRFLTYILNDSTIGFSSTSPLNRRFELRFMDLDRPLEEKIIETQLRIYPATIPMDVIVPRWMKGSPYVTYGYRDENGRAQVREFHALNPDRPPVAVTEDDANKIDGYPVLHPQSGTHYFMSGINASDTAYYYKRQTFGSMFIRYETIVPQTVYLDRPAFNQSHEPFFFQDQLYAAFQINNDGGDFFETTFNQPGEIWMTTIDHDPPLLWRLSEFDSTLSISEPEPYVGRGQAWVYYSAVTIDPTKPYLKRVFQLRRCRTPLNSTTKAETIKSEPKNWQLFQNYPNPFNANTAIRFSLPQRGHVRIRIFDVNGKQIATLIDGHLESGAHEAFFYAAEVGSGIYFYRMEMDGHSETKPMLLIK